MVYATHYTPLNIYNGTPEGVPSDVPRASYPRKGIHLYVYIVVEIALRAIPITIRPE